MQRKSAARKRAAVNAIKLKSGCVDCGFKEHPAALDFDHVRGSKEEIIGRMMNRSLDVIRDEISKCEVRCANCHRIRTWERRQAA